VKAVEVAIEIGILLCLIAIIVLAAIRLAKDLEIIKQYEPVKERQHDS